MSSIKLKNISKIFDGKKVLDNINLQVEEGEMISLLGPSGCGKTTTLKLIAGLISPDKGDIFFNENSVKNVAVERRGAVIVFQDYLLFPHLTIEENISFGLRMRKVSKKKRAKITKEMIELVQLDGQGKKYPNELSGGQRQRVALARALAIEPKVLLLDEPFSNLDLRLRETMREFICDIQKKLNITTILVTHDKEEALMTSSKIAVILDGTIKQFGTPTELYEKPKSVEVADFFGEKNYIEGKIEKGIFKSSLGNFPVKHKNCDRIRAMIRPENIDVFPLENEGENGHVGKIVKRRYAGDRIYYTLDVNSTRLKSVNVPKRVFDINDEVSVKIDFNKIIFYE